MLSIPVREGRNGGSAKVGRGLRRAWLDRRARALPGSLLTAVGWAAAMTLVVNVAVSIVWSTLVTALFTGWSLFTVMRRATPIPPEMLPTYLRMCLISIVSGLAAKWLGVLLGRRRATLCRG